MRQIFIAALLLITMTDAAHGGDITRDSIIKKASYIFSGEVTSCESFYDSSLKRIFTYNYVHVTHFFRKCPADAASEYAVIITEGGRTTNLSEHITHHLQFETKTKGIFFCRPYTRPASEYKSFNNISIPLLQNVENAPYTFINSSGMDHAPIQGLDTTFNSIQDLYLYLSTNVNISLPATVSQSSSNARTEASMKLGISEFMPTEITAGTGSVLKIYGKDFGTERGNGGVYFKSADDGGASIITYTDASDYLFWSNNEIHVLVPSYIKSDPSHRTPGSGTLLIIANNGASITTKESLTIKYALNNQAFDSDPARKGLLHVTAPDFLGKIDIKASPEVLQVTGAAPVVRKAINDWRCITGANLYFSEDASGKAIEGPVSSGYDRIFSVTFTSQLPSAILARTIHFHTECLDVYSKTTIIASKEFDIEINKNIDWYFDTSGTTIPPGKMDFYAVLLHELGHAIGLQHVNTKEEIMFYQVPSIPRKILTSAPSGTGSFVLQAASDMLTQNASVYPSCGDVSTFTKGTCSGNRFNISEGDLLIAPNPALDHLSLAAAFNGQTTVNLQIGDITGRILQTNEFKTGAPGLNTFDLNISALPSGIYILYIKSESKNISTRFVKI